MAPPSPSLWSRIRYTRMALSVVVALTGFAHVIPALVSMPSTPAVLFGFLLAPVFALVSYVVFPEVR